MTTTESPPAPRTSLRGAGETPKVAFFSAEWCTGPAINLGGSDYWRIGLPAAKLYENGWDIVFARNLAENSEGRICVQNPQGEWLEDRDIVVIQRWMGEGTAERVLKARKLGQIIINEVDDDYWNFPESHVARKTSDPEFNKNSNRAHYRETVAASSLITVSTPYLVEQMADWGPPVKMIRNYIDLSWWKPVPPGDYIGWIGGLPWRGKDLELLRETVVPWMRERKMFFYHGGAIPDAQIEDRLGYERVTTRPLATLPEYPKLWEPLKVVLIPMEDTPFNRAKSWCKALEACARGIPFIASDQPEYRELGVGRVAMEPKEWVWHLEALEDPKVYAADVAINRKRVEQLDIADRWTEWADVLQEAVAANT
jgi:hypothetical protein